MGIEHNHAEYFDWCFRCELSKEEAESVPDGTLRIYDISPADGFLDVEDNFFGSDPSLVGQQISLSAKGTYYGETQDVYLAFDRQQVQTLVDYLQQWLEA